MALKLIVNQERPVKAPSDGNPESMQSLESMFLQHKVALFRYILRMVKDEEDALELLQESYARLLDKSAGNSERVTRSYLFTIALNLVRDRARRAASQKQVLHESLDGVELPDVAYGPAEELRLEQGVERLQAALETLPSRARKIFILRRYKNLSCSEIASLLQISKRTVERELVKTIEHCHKRMKDCLV